MKELDKVFEDYISNRNLSDLTRINYKSWYKNHIQPWQPAFLGQLEASDVSSHFKALSEEKPQAANYAFGLLNSLYNFAEVFYREHANLRNPVGILSACKSWNLRPECTNIIPDYREWYESLPLLLPAEQSLMMLLALTGLRYNEIAKLQWMDIGSDYFLYKPKGGQGRPAIRKPLTPYVSQILRRRSFRFRTPYTVCRTGEEHFPFVGEAFYIKMGKQGFPFHCLRRGYQVAGLACGVEELIIKQLLGHSAGKNMTHRYSQGSIEHLISPAIKIEEYLLTKMGI